MRAHIKLALRGPGESVKNRIPSQYLSYFPSGEYVINTDADGYITYPGFVKRENSIFLLGDSFIECAFHPEGGRVSDILNQNYGERLNASFYNAGNGGSTLLSLYNLFVNKIIHLPKASVFLFPGAATASCLYLNDGFWSRTSYSNLTDMNEKGRWHSDVREGEGFARVLKLFKKAAGIFGTDLYIAPTPYNREFHASRVSEKALDSMRELSREFAIRENIPMLDLHDQPRDNGRLFYDKLNLSPSGAKHYSEMIGDFLLSFKGEKNISNSGDAAAI